MLVGTYICASALVCFVVLLAIVLGANPEDRVQDLRKRVVRYSLLALFLSALGFVIFLGASVWTGILLIGQPQQFSLPQDYIEYGIVGWVILLVAVLGLLSPVSAAIITKRN